MPLTICTSINAFKSCNETQKLTPFKTSIQISVVTSLTPLMRARILSTCLASEGGVFSSSCRLDATDCMTFSQMTSPCSCSTCS